MITPHSATNLSLSENDRSLSASAVVLAEVKVFEVKVVALPGDEGNELCLKSNSLGI